MNRDRTAIVLSLMGIVAVVIGSPMAAIFLAGTALLVAAFAPGEAGR